MFFVEIIIAPPPMFDQICAVFPSAANKGVIFTWGNVIFNPSGVNIGEELQMHELVHRDRQNLVESVEKWWERYLVDVEFRLAEELPAHVVEYKTFCRLHRDRNQRANYLHHVAGRLASPLYGNVITKKAALSALLH